MAVDTDPAAGETDDRMTAIWVVVVLITLIVGTAALYLGRAVLLPLATATILSIILSPVMIRLEPYFGRLFSAVLVVLTVIMVIAGVGYVLTVALSNVADQIAGYSENIGNKLVALEKSTRLGSSTCRTQYLTFSVVSRKPRQVNIIRELS